MNEPTNEKVATIDSAPSWSRNWSGLPSIRPIPSTTVEPSAAVLRETLTRVPEEDRALIGMLLDGSSEAEIARTTRQEVKDVRHVVQRVLSTLRQSAPVAG